MRTIIMAALAATTLLPIAASAQSYGEVRQDQRDVRQDQRDVRQDQARGDYRDARADRQNMRDDRREVRQDWRDYRNTNPGAFHRGGYRGPNGFRYRPVTPGYRFAPGYYGRNYWVNDWQNYRLARPLGYQRWVRYGNDVVLVDIRSGTVVSSYNGFFF